MGSRPVSLPDIFDAGRRGVVAAGSTVLRASPLGQFMDPAPTTLREKAEAAPAATTNPRPPIGNPGVLPDPGRYIENGPMTLSEKFAPSREGYGVTDSIRVGAHRDQGGFGEFGSSSPRSLAQTLQDADASQLLDETYGRRAQRFEAAQLDPQGDSLRAKMISAQMEQLMPAEDRPLLSTADQDGAFTRSGNSYTNNGPGLTLRDKLIQEQARLKNASGMLDMGRGRIAEDLEAYHSKLMSRVRPGDKVAEAEAQAKYQIALKRAQDLTSLLKSGQEPVGVPGFGQ